MKAQKHCPQVTFSAVQKVDETKLVTNLCNTSKASQEVGEPERKPPLTFKHIMPQCWTSTRQPKTHFSEDMDTSAMLGAKPWRMQIPLDIRT